MSLLSFEVLTFDCYGTLIDWETGLLQALRSSLALEDRSDGEILESFGRFEAGLQKEMPSLRYPDILSQVYLRLASQWELEADPSRASAFGASVGDWPAFADSGAALRELAKRFRLVILSNVDRQSFARSEARLGVAFDRVFTAEDIGSYKPNPRNFEYMLDHLAADGVARDQVLHVAQSLFHDHEPAGRCGLTGCWIDRRHENPGWGATLPPTGSVHPTYRFPSMAAFAEAVRRDAEEPEDASVSET